MNYALRGWLVFFVVLIGILIMGYLLASLLEKRRLKDKPSPITSSTPGYGSIENTKPTTILDERTGQRWIIVRQGENLTLEKYYPDIKDITIE